MRSSLKRPLFLRPWLKKNLSNDTDLFLVSGVVCRELGFDHGDSLCCGESYGYLAQQDDDPVVLKTACQGNETTLQDCTDSARIGGWNSCDYEYAAVACFTVVPAGRIKLTKTAHFATFHSLPLSSKKCQVQHFHSRTEMCISLCCAVYIYLRVLSTPLMQLTLYE